MSRSDHERPHDEPLGRVIVTHARSQFALAAIRTLGRHGVEVIAADEVPLTPGALSRYATGSFTYPYPDIDPDGFERALVAAVDEHRPPDGRPYALLPMHRETFAIAQLVERGALDIATALPAARAMDTVRHKRRLLEHARRLGARVPDTHTPASADELREIASTLAYPQFVKVPAQAGGVGIERVEDGEALVRAWQDMTRHFQLAGEDLPLVQEMVPGEDFCVTILFDRGTPVTGLVYRNEATLPRGSGPGVVQISVEAPRLLEQAGQLLAPLGWHGIAQVDYRAQTPDEPGWLIEVNPRFFGGLPVAIDSGVDYPWLVFRLAVDGHVAPPAKIALGTRTDVPLLGLLATVRDLASSEVDLSRLLDAWREARAARGDSWWQAARAAWREVAEDAGIEARLERLRAILEDDDSIASILDGDDPLAALGMLYPLVLFARHGRIDTEELSSGIPSGAR